MKKIVFLFLTATLLLSCSAERRLSVFLARHPELQHTDTLYIHDSIIRPEEKATTSFTLQDLSDLQEAAKTNPDTTQSKTLPSPKIEVETNGSTAAITANPNGSFSLTSTQKPDTIYKDRFITVPSYVTQIKKEPVYINKLTSWQDFWVKFGKIAAVFIALAILMTLVKKYA